jgi:hypothetical protein
MVVLPVSVALPAASWFAGVQATSDRTNAALMNVFKVQPPSVLDRES